MTKKKTILLIIILPMLIISSLSAQDSIVNGKIIAGKNMPLKDVSVSVEGSDASPVLTNESGEFTLTVPNGNVWLIITPLEYKKKRVFLNNRKNLIISLSDFDQKSGYDQVEVVNMSGKRRDVAGAMSTIEPQQVEKSNANVINGMYPGNVSGMHSMMHSGMPGTGSISYLRGVRSMNTTNMPLVIVDGIPMENPGTFSTNLQGFIINPVNSINTNEISSVSVLKDPTLYNVYGSKAANGVILISTVQPTATETSIDASVNYGYNTITHRQIPQLNDVQYRSLANEILASSSINEEFFEDLYPGLLVNREEENYFRYNHNTKWQDLIFTDAQSIEANVIVKGGSEIAKYGLSVGYLDEAGIIQNTHYDRFNVRFVSDLNVATWFKMKVHANLTDMSYELKESAISDQTSPIMTSLAKPPFMAPYEYDEDGGRLNLLDDVDEFGTSNPLSVIESFLGENRNTRFMGSILSEFDITQALSFNSRFGLTFNAATENIFMPNRGMENYSNDQAWNIAQGMENQIFTIFSDNYFNYNVTLARHHNLALTAGARVQINSLEIDYAEAQNLPPNDQFTDLGSGQNELRFLGGNNAKWNWLSAYNSIQYSFKDKYIVNTGLSTDFSTLTGNDAEAGFEPVEGMPFFFYYSAGLGWRISSEEFLKKASILDNLMLRASYGTSGNDDLGYLTATDYYYVSRYRETSSLVPTIFPNTALKPEVTEQLNVGMDLSLLGDRTALSVDYYIATTSDVVVLSPQESYLGVDYIPVNAGEVQNKGLEVTFFQRIIGRKDFSFDFSANFSTLHNEVLSITDNGLETSFTGGAYISSPGNALNSFYGYQFEGVYATQQEAANAGLLNEKGFAYGAGDAIYTDFSGPDGLPDGIINNYDKIALGSPLPEFFGGSNLNVKYKRWALDLFVQFVYGNEIFNYVRYKNESMTDLSNQSVATLNRWHTEGDETDIPRALWQDPIGNSAFSSRWIEDGSHINFKRATLSYTINERFSFIKNARFYASVDNIFALHNYLGYDPIFSYSFSPMQQGIDYGLMPTYRKFIVGLKIGL